MAGRTRLKICGMTELFEVEQAVAAGVDALGFIFADKSPRAIEPERARALIGHLPPFVDAVGVFVNEDPARVREIINFCGLTVSQLHGQEPPEYCALVPGRVIKAMQVAPDMTADLLTPYNDVVCAFLLDTYHPEMVGGTGKSFDWSIIDRLAPVKSVILAGGLGPDNVEEAIAQVHPFAVDVNSAIEMSPGRKDVDKIKELAKAIARADAG